MHFYTYNSYTSIFPDFCSLLKNIIRNISRENISLHIYYLYYMDMKSNFIFDKINNYKLITSIYFHIYSDIYFFFVNLDTI